MLDLIVHAAGDDIASLTRSIPAALESVKVPTRVLVAATGRPRKALDEVQDLLEHHQGTEWLLLHDSGQQTPTAMIQAALNEVRGRVIAVLDGSYEIDGAWFGRVQQVVAKDPMAWMVGTELGWKPNTMQPFSIKRKNYPDGPLIVFTRTALQRLGTTITSPEESFARAFSDLAHKNGGRRWIVPSIRFSKLDSARHPVAKS